MAQPSADFLAKAVFLVDASSYIFRAYYGIQNPLTAPDGTPTHATYAFGQMVELLLKNYPTDECVLLWDRKEKGFRHEAFPDYKANRSEAPEDLGLQIENTKLFMKHMGIAQFELPGYEADDLIATFIEKFPQKNFVIVTADKDLLQLVGDRVWCLDTFKNKWSNRDEAKEKFGVPPDRIAEIQALCGDSVDNIPGAPGIGPKGAAQLMEEFGSLAKILEAAERRWKNPEECKGIADCLKGKKLESIATNIDKVLLSLKLVSLAREAPIAVEEEALRRKEVQHSDLVDFARKMGFRKIVEKLEAAAAKASEEKAPSAAPAPTLKVEERAGYKFHTLENIEAFKKLLARHEKSLLLTLDTETKSLEVMQPRNLVGISLSFGNKEGFYLPIRHLDTHNVESAEAIAALQLYLDARPHNFQLVFQNAKFDLHVLQSEGLHLPEVLRVEDTMIASFVLDPASQHGMDALAQKYLDGYTPVSFQTVLGDRKDFSQVPLAEAAAYSAEDAVVTYDLWQILESKLRDEGLWKVYNELDRPLIQVLLGMERNGIHIDRSYLRELSTRFHKDLEQCTKDAFQILKDAGLDFNETSLNLASTKQMAVVLFDQLKLPVIKKGKTGPSTDVSVLDELSARHPFPSKLLEFREISKLLSTYVDSLGTMVDTRTDRLHTDFSQTIAQTGRLASSNPNLQNIPIRTPRGKLIREAFRPREGWSLLGFDYSQIELRILAHMSEAPELIRAFEEGADIHRRTASLIFRKSEEALGEDERRAAKTINFGIIYGQSAFGLSKTLRISRTEAQSFIENYFKSYPQIKNYLESMVELARKNTYVETLTGRRRWLRDIHSKNPPLRQFAERMAVNSPLQGTAADLMKAAMIKVHEELRKDSWKSAFLLQVHDELIFEAPPEEVQDLQTMVVGVMEDPALLKSFGIHKFRVKMKAASEVGAHWGEI
jgi:DNA polymerase-1